MSGLARHPDLARTLLEHFGLPVPDAIEGFSLWPALHDECWAGCGMVYLTGATWQAK